jgi:regulator of nucleoside diphosphate kinase
MSLSLKPAKLPKIIVTDTEKERLMRLANAAMARMPEVAESLLVELERARVVQPDKIQASVVRMNSRVKFVYDDGEERDVKLVYPDEANISENRVSVLTPSGPL